MIPGNPAIVSIEEMQGIDVVVNSGGQLRPVCTAHGRKQECAIGASSKADLLIKKLDGHQICAGVAGLAAPVVELIRFHCILSGCVVALIQVG